MTAASKDIVSKYQIKQTTENLMYETNKNCQSHIGLISDYTDYIYRQVI